MSTARSRYRAAHSIVIWLQWLRRCVQIAAERWALVADEDWIRELEHNRATDSAHYAETCAQRDSRRVRIALLERARDNLREALQ